MKCEVAISNRSGGVTGRMRHPTAPSHPTGPGHPTTSQSAGPGQSTAPSQSAATWIERHPKSQIKDRDRDLSECERESAFAGAGDKRQVFNKCMKARGY